MSARDDYLALARLASHPDTAHRVDAAAALDEIDRLRASCVGVLIEEVVNPTPITSRILWNVRGGDIDEIVISDCTVHVEQMDKRCWWIGIRRADGGYWAGNFVCRKGRMTFTEQEHEGFQWDHEDAHEEAT